MWLVIGFKRDWTQRLGSSLNRIVTLCARKQNCNWFYCLSSIYLESFKYVVTKRLQCGVFVSIEANRTDVKFFKFNLDLR